MELLEGETLRARLESGRLGLRKLSQIDAKTGKRLWIFQRCAGDVTGAPRRIRTVLLRAGGSTPRVTTQPSTLYIY